MTPFPSDESKDTKNILKTMGQMKGLIRSIANDSDNYDEKNVKIKFNSDGNLPLKKTLELQNKAIVVCDCNSWLFV